MNIASVLRTTLPGKLFQTLTIRPLKKLAQTVAVELFFYSYSTVVLHTVGYTSINRVIAVTHGLML